MKNCEEQDCKEEGVIGWGCPPTMVCMTHFNERLTGVREVLDHARQICGELFYEDAG